VPQVSGERLLRLVLPRAGRRVHPPREAGFRMLRGRPVVVPGAAGLRLHADDLGRGFLRLVRHRDGRVGPLPTTRVEPSLTTEEARGLGVRQVVARATVERGPLGTLVGGIPDGGADRAADALDGTVLRPGDVLSLRRVLGQAPRPGDGTDLLAGALYDAALRAGLGVVERHPHPTFDDRFAPGRDAWVEGRGTDLRLRDGTSHGVLVRVVRDVEPSGGRRLTVELWSTRTWDVRVSTGPPTATTAPRTTYHRGSGCVPRDGRPGFTVVVVREFRRPGDSAVDHTDRTRTTYAPSDTVLCR
jgi:vancomycin resistance protein YoaR